MCVCEDAWGVMILVFSRMVEEVGRVLGPECPTSVLAHGGCGFLAGF